MWYTVNIYNIKFYQSYLNTAGERTGRIKANTFVIASIDFRECGLYLCMRERHNPNSTDRLTLKITCNTGTPKTPAAKEGPILSGGLE